MKLRLGWLADAEDSDSYSARETRILLRALARRRDIVPLWFAVGSTEPPHHWNGIRIFPVPAEQLGTPNFLRTLIEQQRPRVVLSNLPRSAFPAGLQFLAQNGTAWLDRVNPADAGQEAAPEPTGGAAPGRRLVLAGRAGGPAAGGGACLLPYLRGVDPAVPDGEEPTAVLGLLERVIAEAVGLARAGSVEEGAPCREGFFEEGGFSPGMHLVMRQQLFCNGSLAHVMFELTNALIELGVPTVPQDEVAALAKGFIHREEELLRAGAPEKHKRIAQRVSQDYDPESAIVVHFCMLTGGAMHTRFGTFQSLTPHEALYTTGNHTMTPEGVRQLTRAFDMVLAPSMHVLRPYLEAGLSPGRGAVIPHGIDPAVFRPEAPPLAYATEKRFKFLQTSFPWVCEKGFDLSIQAFCRAFTCRDDVALVLRVPCIRGREERRETFGRLEALVKEAARQLDAPEIVLAEMDVALNHRGGVYTGADCYLFPLRAEGFGMTILEAMGCGLPGIATAWSGPADFLSARYAYCLRHSNPVAERTKDGSLLRFHVEPDMEHLIHLMRHVYEHRDEARRLGQAAASVARDRWTWRHAAAKLASVLNLAPRRTDLAGQEQQADLPRPQPEGHGALVRA